MKKLIVIFDDRQRPADDIREITGDKSFGRIIFRRRSLRDAFISDVSDILDRSRLQGEVRCWSNSSEIPVSGSDRRKAVVLIFSDAVIKDAAELSVVLKKAAYCEDDYRVTGGNKTFAVIYKDADSFYRDAAPSADPADMRERAAEFNPVPTDAFFDISERDSFLSFITGGFEARFFNSLSGDRYTVIKKSSSIDKIRSEYEYYRLLPESMKSWFVLPYDYKEENGFASYKMQRYHMTDLAIRYVHGAISPEEFKRILDTVFVFLKERREKDVMREEFYEIRKRLYINKVENRIGELKNHPEFPRLEKYIANGTGYFGIDDILKKYEELYDRITGNSKDRFVMAISHGDLCFSNILYSLDSNLIRFIDPKGALREEELYSDPLYDVAKLSHSICGRYDYMNSGCYEIDMDEGMRLRLKIDGDVKEFREIFERKLVEEGMDPKTVRLFECSLFLSMLPLHMDRPQKVMAFILNAVEILNEVGSR